MGPPGSGKGTQSDLLGEKLEIPKIDIGSILRKRADKEDEVGQKIHTLQNEGKMVSDDMLEPIIEPEICVQPESGFIIDGYCRNSEQVKHIIDWQKKGIIKDPLVVNLEVDTDATLERIKKRRYCASCNEIKYIKTPDQTDCAECGEVLAKREDDNVDTFMKRVETYRKQALPARKVLENMYPFITIKGDQTIEAVAEDIYKQVKPLWG